MNKKVTLLIITFAVAVVSVCLFKYYAQIMTALAPISEFGAKIVTLNGW